MLRFSALALSTLLVSAVLPASAAAQPSTTPPTAAALATQAIDRPWLLNVHVGLAAPGGNLAVELERNLLPTLSASIATGVATGGPQLAANLRLRNPTGAWRTGVGGGLSQGDYSEWFVIWGEPTTLRDTVWANGEAFVEYRGDSGVSFRLYAGMSHLIDHGACEGDSCDSAPGVILPEALPFAGTALGAAF